MKSMVVTFFALLACTGVFADSHCDKDALVGDWEIFFVDPKLPGGHPGMASKIHIKRDSAAATGLDFDLEDPDWEFVSGSLKYECSPLGNPYVKVTIMQGSCEHDVSVSRVTEASDLKSRPGQEPNEKQIYLSNFAHSGDCGAHKAEAQAMDDVHPGHIHGDGN